MSNCFICNKVVKKVRKDYICRKCFGPPPNPDVSLSEQKKKIAEQKREFAEQKREFKEQKREFEEQKKKFNKRETDAIIRERNVDKKTKEFEVRTGSIRNMLTISKKMQRRHPDGFTTKKFTQKYIKHFPNINPYTLKEVDDSYDIHAAIRGLMYETSPSSTQHWFRFGTLKHRKQVAPWIFANKNLAEVNNEFQWKSTTPEHASARRQRKGLWKVIDDNWNEAEYGPLPSNKILKEAEKDRKKGNRSRY